MSSPFTSKGRWYNFVSLGLGFLVLLTPCALCAATLPGNGRNGFLDVPDINLLETHWPVPGMFGLRALLWLIFVLFALPVTGILIVRHADHGLLFGCLTMLATLAMVAAFVSVFARRSVEDQAGRIFLILAVAAVFVLALTAHDWARRQFLFAAAVTAATLSIFIVRVGFESLKVPPQWERNQIAARAIADEDALNRQHQYDQARLIKAVKDARTAVSGIVNSKPPPNLDKPLLDQAKVILAHSEQVVKNGKTESPDDFSRFFTLMGNRPAAAQPPVAAKLANAVRTLQAAESAAITKISSTALDRAICPISPSARKCGTIAPVKITTNSQWVADRHELDVQLATFRAQVTRTNADEAALKAVLAQQPDVDEDISILSAIKNGPETLWRSAHRTSGPALVPGPLGWVMLGAVLLGLLAWLLRVNASQLPGPVSVMPDQPADGGKSGTDDKLVTALRVAVLENLPEPGAAPGAPSIDPVTTLLDATGGPLSAVSKAVQAVLGVIGQRYGYKVTIDVTSGGAAIGASTDAGSTTVLVRVMSLTSGVTYASQLCRSPHDTEAVWTAGLWAAGFILNRSTRIPHWAAWQADTARALVIAKDTAGQNIPALRAALMEAPNSGLLLVLLGHKLELAGQTLDAIECYARAVTAYPRYVVARYRLAEALASMRHRQDWMSQDKDKRQDALRAVKSAISALKTKGACEICKLEKNDNDRGKARDNLEVLAITLLRALEIDTRWWYRLLGTLRRSERTFIWPTLAPNSTHPAARFHPLVKSARQAVDYEHGLKKLSRKADKPDTWWQIGYNAACGHATRAESLVCPTPVGSSSEASHRIKTATVKARHGLDDRPASTGQRTRQKGQALRDARDRFGPGTPTDIRRKAAALLRCKGYSDREIGRVFGVTGATIGVDLRQADPVSPELDVAQALDELAACVRRTQAKTAKKNDVNKALDFLEQTLSRPGVEQLTADWPSRDPDLAVLASDPRFQRFLAQLRTGA
jgi:tetratricopeptide (TPR) repeat protein